METDKIKNCNDGCCSSNKKCTKERILEQAAEVFANKGFHQATILDICDPIKVNVASVNYHFGDKKNLYTEVIWYSLNKALEKFPIITDPAIPVRERIKQNIKTTFGRAADDSKASIFSRIIVQEMGSPTDILAQISEEMMKPFHKALVGIIKEYIGDNVPEKKLWSFAICLISQCVFFAFNRNFRVHFLGQSTLTKEQSEMILENITEFSLAALDGLKEKYKNEAE